MAKSRRERRIEQEFFPDGRLKSETPYVGDAISGVVRHWYENGTLLSETGFLNSEKHGFSRRWNESGRLIYQCEYDHGSGLALSWYDDGQLASELPIRHGGPHGRQRVWDEGGELVTEAYYILGRKVSKKKYVEATAKDLSLPRYDTKEVAPGWADRQTAPLIEAPVDSALDDKDARNALEWLTGSSPVIQRTLGELGSAQESIKLVQSYLDQGAKRVLVHDIQTDDNLENSGSLLVELPDKGTIRKRVLALCNEQNELCGFRCVKDTGQRFVHVALD